MQGPCSGSFVRSRVTLSAVPPSRPGSFLTSQRFLRGRCFGLFCAGPVAHRPLVNGALSLRFRPLVGPCLRFGLFYRAFAFYFGLFLLGACVARPLLDGAFDFDRPCAGPVFLLAASCRWGRLFGRSDSGFGSHQPLLAGGLTLGIGLFCFFAATSCRCYATHCSGRRIVVKGVRPHLTKCCGDET